MVIGLDMSVIQTPHRMRGIGSVAVNFVNSLSSSLKKKHTFIFYLYRPDQESALSLLNLTDVNYEVRNIDNRSRINLKLPGKLRIVNTLLNNINDGLLLHFDNARIKNTTGIDTFLQFDPMQPLPKSRKFKRTLIIYDLIPYIMEADYLWSYSTARRHRHSRKGSFRRTWLRKKYISTIRSVSKRADLLIAISKHTKNDYVAYAGVSRDKVKVIHLGIDRSLPSLKNVEFQEYYETGWGYSRKSIDLTTKPFLLFLGGADPRRKLIHLVAAYNNLKAQGHDIRLVMVGDIMKGPSSIPIIDVQNYLSESSYLDDISFLGFVSDPQREWLYSHAKAMVYPSVYEGFGLPILEAMQHGTPVITYDNSSIREVAGSAAIYAYGANDIKDCVEKLLLDKRMWEKYGKLGREQASKFDWQKTAKSIVNELIS